MTDDQIKHMVNRFLGWQLPEDFHPDAGISFKREHSEHAPWGPVKHQPSGTNLLNASQAEAMIRHLVEGLEPSDELERTRNALWSACTFLASDGTADAQEEFDGYLADPPRKVGEPYRASK